ncbi:hypothetical protein KCU62_g7435, partial [Aureobasidium sp. EXF-3399]
MDDSQANQAGRGLARNENHDIPASHDGQHQPLHPMLGDMASTQGMLDQDLTLDDFSNAPFDYSSLSNLYIPSSDIPTNFVSPMPPMDNSATFEPSYNLLGTAEGKGLEIPHGWSNEYMADLAPLASSLASREIQRSGKSWSQILADGRKQQHSGLPRRRSRYRLSRMDSSSTSASIPIPESSSAECYDPLQRYQNSPPEDDYVSMAAVQQALQSSHFRAGRTMKDWRGDHEFEPEIASRVTNAIPPYLIGDETETLVPFSSTSHVARDHVAQISSRLTAMPSEPSEPTSPLPLTPELEVPSTQNNNLTLNEMVIFHLGRYGRQQLSLGITPTDEMFQNEARRLLYDSDDAWNQCLVDNPEWMAAFRLLHGWTNTGV